MRMIQKKTGIGARYYGGKGKNFLVRRNEKPDILFTRNVYMSISFINQENEEITKTDCRIDCYKI